LVFCIERRHRSFSFALITAVTTSITPVGNTSKRILLTIGKGDGMAMGNAAA
jgi:hypothetical protein